MSFAEQLKKARITQGLTQQHVADLMGISNSTYSGYETGKRQPDVIKIKQLASVLNTSGDVLLETGFVTEKEINPENKIQAIAKELNLTELQLEILENTTNLKDYQQKIILDLIKSLQKNE